VSHRLGDIDLMNVWLRDPLLADPTLDLIGIEK
jgi:hypothetical protein